MEGMERKNEMEEDNLLGFSFLYQNKFNSIPDISILIDTGSTISVFKNRHLMEDIKRNNNTLRAYTNGGYQDWSLQGHLPGFFRVWYNPSSMVNILAWCDVRKKYRITADTEVEPDIKVHMNNGKIMSFKELSSGLYLADIKDYQEAIEPKQHVFTNLTSDNKANFTNSQIRAAETARELFTARGMLSYKKFMNLLKTNAIKNCPVTADDIKRILFIWGPELATIKGKTTRIAPPYTQQAQTPFPFQR